MNLLKACFLTLMLATFTACQPPSTDDAPSQTTALSLPNNKISVINYWASWCKPCIKEIPELNHLAANHPSVAVFGINFDGIQAEELAAEVKRFDIQYTVADKAFGEKLGINLPSVLPTTVILNGDGDLLHTLIGPQTEAELTHLINGMITKPE